MLKRLCHLISVAALVVAVAIPANAQLARVGPVDSTNGGYPAWYQDKTGLALEFCKPTTQSELNGGWCLILPANVPNGSVPEVAFSNYSPEHFFWNATAGARTAGAGAVLVLSLEGAFANNNPVAGDQIVFGRLRIVIPSLPQTGDYKIYTPFGDFDFPNQTQGDRLFFTTDIGIGCGADFTCALNSAIGPFLLPSATPGGPEMAPLTAANPAPDPDPAHFGGVVPPVTAYPGTGKPYISDPARIGPVTGSPLPPFVSPVDGRTYDHNRFRIEVSGTVWRDEVNFSTAGRVMTGTLPAKVTVNRASYTTPTATNPSNKLDVFATAAAAIPGRLPGAPAATSTNPDLGYYDQPCATDPTTGVVTGPPAGAGLYFHMFNDGSGRWWGGNSPVTIPPQVCVQDLNARDANGFVIPAYYMGDVTDEVRIAAATWDPTNPAGGGLTVTASSSDTANAPVLSIAGYNTQLAGGTALITPLAAPPAKVTVVSTRGGVATLDTTTGVGVPVAAGVPIAVPDSATTPEDTPVTVDVVSNDTLGGQPITSGAVVTITAAPALGSAIANGTSITFTPNLNVNGTDIVGYTVSVNGGPSSPEGYLTVNITPVNDPPVAVNDSGGAPNNKSVTFNLLANDTDPDGTADLNGAVIASLPAVGVSVTCNGGAPIAVGTACLGGSVTITPTTTGTFSFTYQAQDKALAVSANTATVTVTVNATENIGITKSIYTQSKGRWTVTGTDNTPAGQTLTIAYTSGTYKVAGACTGNATGFVVGTAPVDALGNWTFDQILTTAGLINPSNTGGNSTGFWCTPPKQIIVTSPLGGSNAANISLK